MSRLELRDMVHQRGADGNLLPLEVELESLREFETVEEDGKKVQKIKTPGPTVKIIPMTRGQIKELTKASAKNKESKGGLETSKDQDGELIKNHLIEPELPENKIADLKPAYSNAIATAILAISLEKDQKIMQEAGKKAVKEYADKLDEAASKK